MRSSYVGVEIGASKHQIALGDTEGNLLKQKAGKVMLEEGAEGILAWMRQHIPSMISEAHANGYEVKGIGIGFGGIVESDTGCVMASVQVRGWENFGVRKNPRYHVAQRESQLNSSGMRLCLLIFIASSLCLMAQEGTSLADAAKKARDGKAKSKVVINEENFVSNRGPLPDLNLDGLDNSDDVFKAIDKYRLTHSKQETEQVVHDWYDRYDAMLEHAIQQNFDIVAQAQDRATYPTRYPDDYKRYAEQRGVEVRSAIQDERLMRKNNLLTARIQQGFQKIRNSLWGMGVRYDWMKIRFGNGNGSW
jgi:hypothetical protein